MSPTRSLLHLLGRGAGPVIRRVWTLTCDRETRRPRPRRDGAKLTGPVLRAVSGTGVSFAAEHECGGGIELSCAKQVFQPGPESIFLEYYLSILHLPASEKTTKRSITDLTARNLHASGLTPQNLRCLVQNRGFNPGSRATRGGALAPRPPSCVTNRRAQPHAARRNSRRRRRAGPQKYGLGF